MTTVSDEKPEWLKNFTPQQGTQRPNGSRGFMPGVSGNPAGRPKGSKAKKTLVALEFEKEGSNAPVWLSTLRSLATLLRRTSCCLALRRL